MFKKSTKYNYFLSISFEWRDMFNILEVPKEERTDFIVSDKYYYKSLNAHIDTDLDDPMPDINITGIDYRGAIFEYYILPNSVTNGKYTHSTIFDQQLKRFFESPNINYGPVLKGKENKDSSLVCFFSKNMVDNMAGFAISYSNQDKLKAAIFLFNKDYLNLEDRYHCSYAIPFESFEIYTDDTGENITRKISDNPESLLIRTSLQSYDDGQSSPFDDVYKYFKK